MNYKNIIKSFWGSWPKRIGIVIAGTLILSIAVFTVAGLMPGGDIYSKNRRSVYVTMKDGIKLCVRYSLPFNIKKGEKVPAILETTRYGTDYKYTFVLNALINLGIAHDVPPAIVTKLLNSKYAYVDVDARGSGASFGVRRMEWSREEADDIGEIISWITKQNWSNGKVGTYGMSYSGNTAEAALASDDKGLFAAAPLYPDFDIMRQIGMPGGILNEVIVKDWGNSVVDMDKNKGSFLIAGNSPVDEDKDEKLLNAAIKGHRTINLNSAFRGVTYFDDTLVHGYRANELSPYNYRKNIEESKVPMYIRVGWQDAGTVNGSLARFNTYSNPQTLVIGPWSHGGWNFCDPFIKSSLTKKDLDKMQGDVLMEFYNGCLRGKYTNKIIKYYTLGEGKWKTSDTWPVKGFENKKMYFGSKNTLNITKPRNEDGEDGYRVDFTASTGKGNRWFTNDGGGTIDYPDRSKEDKKLLTYTSKALVNDTEITGVPTVTLNLSSTSDDGAFYAYLEDVAPNGKVTYITEGEVRALHRKEAKVSDVGYNFVGIEHSYLKRDGQKLIPGRNAEVKIGMFATSVLIKKGHSIRIAIAGHDAASFKRIPEIGNPVIKIQRNNTLSSYAEIPMKVVK